MDKTLNYIYVSMSYRKKPWTEESELQYKSRTQVRHRTKMAAFMVSK